MSKSPPWLNACVSLLKKVIRKAYSKRTLFFFAHEFADNHRSITESDRFEYKRISKDDLAYLHSELHKYAKDCARFLSVGHIGFAGIDKQTGMICSMVWYATQSFHDEYYHCNIDLEPDEIFQMAGETATPFRKTRVTPGTMFSAWDYWQNQANVNRVVLLVQDDNTPSLKFVLSAGCREQGRLMAIRRIFNWYFPHIEHYQGERLAHLNLGKRGMARVQHD